MCSILCCVIVKKGRKINMQETIFIFKTPYETMNVSLNSFNSEDPDGQPFMSSKTSFNEQHQCWLHPGLEGLLRGFPLPIPVGMGSSTLTDAPRPSPRPECSTSDDSPGVASSVL